MVQRLLILKLLLVLSLLSCYNVLGQTVVKGTITDASDGSVLPGATIMIKGTSNGVSTDFEGNYSITIANQPSVLVFSFVGYTNKEVLFSGQTTINVSLTEDAEQLEEIVVTALGIKRAKKALGYSLTKVKGEELAQVKQVNAINALQGKVAGVNITGAATGPSGTSRVVIRGGASINGSNQPLYIVDGIPINNQNLGAASRWGGADFGDGISSINPDDIKNISVLKGAAAAALYGSNAGNGVIIITTKSGKSQQQKLGVEFSSSTLLESVNTDLYDFQTEYGQGENGIAPTTSGAALSAQMGAWGPKLGSVESATQFDGVNRPYDYTGNNIEKFYKTATTLTNTLAISKAGEGYNIRFSATDLTNQDIMPNSGLNRKSFSLNGGLVMSDKLTLDVSTKYILEDVKNRPRLSDSPGNGNFTVTFTPPNIDIFDYQPGYNADGTELRISSSVYHQNPYFAAYKFSNQSNKNRFIGSSTLRYNINDWLYVLGRAGIDQFISRNTNVEPWGTAYKNQGGMTETTYNVSTIDADIMLGIDRDLGGEFSTTTIFGANSNSFTNEKIDLIGTNFVITGLEDISNVDTKDYSYTMAKVKKGSLYFSSEWSYKDFLFLTVTGRKDWFSTLSLKDKATPNAYFYPSVSTSFIFSDAFEVPKWFSYGKVRAGYSEVANGASSPYLLAIPYSITDTYQGDNGATPLGDINTSTLGNIDLKPSSKSEYEVGLEVGFFNSRLGLDLTYYNSTIVDDIVPISVSKSSGYNSYVVNIGELSNKGIEVLLTGTPVETTDFKWDVSYNLGYNENEVIKTDEFDNPFFPGDQAVGVNSQSGAIVGKPYGAIYGTTFVRNDEGKIQYDAEGRPVVGPNDFLGNGIAPYSMGLTNTFRYKNFNFNFLIDAKFGADIFSGTSAFANYNGASKNTLVGRETGLTVNGVDGEGNDFTTTIPAENINIYYQRLYSIAEAHIQSADFIKLRELSLGYNFTDQILSKTFLSSANISLIARNLFFLMRKTENIDPESAFNSSFGVGLERSGLPSTRSYGLSLNVKF